MRLKGSVLSHTTRLCTSTLAPLHPGETEAPELGLVGLGSVPSLPSMRAHSVGDVGPALARKPRVPKSGLGT